MRRLLPVWTLLALVGAGCPAVNSQPCDSDAQCPDGRCREGACGPFCELDAECGSDQVCRDGACLPRPECATTSECARGFRCEGGQCRCESSDACARNQLCLQGRCEAQPACDSDADCLPRGLRCELTQGICIPPCTSPSDCAPGVDPNLAAALYQCFQGACQRRCTTDASCGSGLICQDGLCAEARCATLADCPAGTYCTSASNGRCLEYQPCTSTTQCAANHRCERFPDGSCPPGFDCAQTICRELPGCLIDADCAPTPPSYCQDRHCQPTVACPTGAECAAGQLCVAGSCYPGGCRGPADCVAPQACVDGACASPPAASAVTRLEVTPSRAVLRVGDTLQLTLVAFRLDGSSFPLSSATFTVEAEGGGASSAATVSSGGLVTAVAAGSIQVRAQVGFAQTTARLSLVDALSAGRRVVVVDRTTRLPLAGIAVAGCDGPSETAPCAAPVEVTTDAAGVALFPSFSAATASFSMVAAELRGDGLPRYERASIPFTTVTDVLVPLGENPVQAGGGFNATLTFSEVHSQGPDWLGFAALSFADPTEVDPVDLLGEPFFFTEPFTGTRLPIPGAAVLFRQVGFGTPVALKDRSFGTGEAGRRNAIGLAGKVDFQSGQAFGSSDPLAYSGALDYALRGFTSVPHRPFVADAQDVDNDRLCSDATRCPQGTEEVPDYFNLPGLSFAPRREQLRRTELIFPNLPAALDRVVVAAVESSSESGSLPLGFASRTAGAAGVDGTRPVPSLVLRSGAPYAGVEAGQPGIWATAAAFGGQGFSGSGGNYSGQLLRFGSLPAKVTLPAFLPLTTGAAFDPGTRTFSPGPSWTAVAGGGAQLVKVVLTGAQSRHVVYLPVSATQAALRIPDPPPSTTGVDPASEVGVATGVIAIRSAGTDELLELSGANLLSLTNAAEAWSRYTP